MLLTLADAPVTSASLVLSRESAAMAHVSTHKFSLAASSPPGHPLLEDPKLEDNRSTPIYLDRSSKSVSGKLLVTLENESWSKTKERHFMELVMKKAAGEASADELAEINRLQQLRRKTSPTPNLSSDEALYHFKRRQLERELLEKFEKYVEFVSTQGGKEA